MRTIQLIAEMWSSITIACQQSIFLLALLFSCNHANEIFPGKSVHICDEIIENSQIDRKKEEENTQVWESDASVSSVTDALLIAEWN